MVLTLLLWAMVSPASATADAGNLQTVLDAAPPGTIVTVTGVQRGNFVIRRPLRLVGDPGAVLDGGGRGTVLRILSPRVAVNGLTIRGSGADLNTEDAGIFLGAPGAVLEDLVLDDVLFGINLKQAHGTVVRRVTMRGKDMPLSRRGDAVRLWYSDRVTMTEVMVRRLRDVLVWFSTGSTLHGLDVADSRYGAHLMYANESALLESMFDGNAVGVYVMYSRGLRIQGNRIVRHRDSTGVGIAVKESDDVVVRGNLVVAGHTGLYVDGTPLEVGGRGEFIDNVVAYNDIGMILLSSAVGNVIAGNTWVGNAIQVQVEGGVRQRNVWTRGGTGNYWSDYAGLDGDDDGIGDRPYRIQRWFEALSAQWPQTRLLWGSAAAAAIDFAARLLPVFAPEAVLEDPRPLIRGPVDPRFGGPPASIPFAAISLLMAAAGGAVLAAARYRSVPR
jgi:nitrous oxidase accessory protein